MEDGSPLSGILLILLIIILIGFVNLIKTAFENVNENTIKKRMDHDEIKANILLKLLQHYERNRMAMELLLGFSLFLMAWVTINLIPNLRIGLLESPVIINSFYILCMILLIFISVLLGVILPKKLAIKYADDLGISLQRIMNFLCILLYPLAWFLEKTLVSIFGIFGVKPSELEENVTEDELISIVNEGQEQGVFDADDAEMISNIIELDEKEAQDIMTPKKKIIAINVEMNLEDALVFMLNENYSRYPLYESNRDNIIGILHLKDVIKAYISDHKEISLREIAREAFYVPDTQNIKILFQEMQSKKIHMAIVIDEYGQTAGLVALEDFIEEIVGNIQDEYDMEEKMILSIEDNSYLVRGAISLEELEEDLNIDINHEDFDTLNGLLISILDRIPGDGETAVLEHAGYRFEILDTKKKMIERVRISKIIEIEDDEEKQEEEIIEE